MSEVCGTAVRSVKLPHFHSLDHALIRGKTVFAIAEVGQIIVLASHKRVMKCSTKCYALGRSRTAA